MDLKCIACIKTGTSYVPAMTVHGGEALCEVHLYRLLSDQKKNLERSAPEEGTKE